MYSHKQRKSSRFRWTAVCWDRGFESRWEYECSSLVFVVCCEDSGRCDELITYLDESYQVYVLRIAFDLETTLLRRPTPELGCCGTKINCTRLLFNLQYLQHCHITRHISSSFASLKLSEGHSTALLSPEQPAYLALKALVCPLPPCSVESTGICGPVYCLYVAWDSSPAYVTFQEVKDSWRCHMDSFVRRETHRLTFAEGCT